MVKGGEILNLSAPLDGQVLRALLERGGIVFLTGIGSSGDAQTRLWMFGMNQPKGRDQILQSLMRMDARGSAECP